jgi:hypothetical protein
MYEPHDCFCKTYDNNNAILIYLRANLTAPEAKDRNNKKAIKTEIQNKAIYIFIKYK